jgi:hypothetical protein
MWLEGLGQLKNPMISSGIDPATFKPVALCLNQLSYHMSPELLDADVKFTCHVSLTVFKLTMW